MKEDNPHTPTLSHSHTLTTSPPGVPRWPATVALVGLGAVFYLIAARYPLGPRWLIPTVIGTLLVPLWLTRLRGLHHLSTLFSRALVVALTCAVVASATRLIVLLPGDEVGPLDLLRYAALIWVANIGTFALWYWEIDGGGPALRHPGRHASTDFAFPQQQLDDDGIVEGWSPGFIDYLFLAFNTSTAFSPTDTLVLSRRAKGLLMLQSLISLLVLAVLAARAINTIGN